MRPSYRRTYLDWSQITRTTTKREAWIGLSAECLTMPTVLEFRGHHTIWIPPESCSHKGRWNQIKIGLYCLICLSLSSPKGATSTFLSSKAAPHSHLLHARPFTLPNSFVPKPLGGVYLLCGRYSGKIAGTEMNKTQSLPWKISKSNTGHRHKTTTGDCAKYYNREMYIFGATGMYKCT